MIFELKNKNNSSWKTSFFVFTFCCLLFSSFLFSSADINKQINYQGKLTDDANSAVPDGSYDMIFKLYDADTSGTLLWTGTHTTANSNSVTVTNGIFSVLLGSGTGNTLNLDFNSDTYYLQVEIYNSDTPAWETLSPRKQLGSVPSSFNSDRLDGLDSATSGANAHIVKTDSSGNLTISGNTYFNGTTYYVNSSGTANLNGLTLAGNLNVNSNQFLVDTSTGYIGIGTATPTTALDVTGTVTATAFVGDGSGLTNLPAGLDGSTWLSGTATPPSDSLGVNGDFYYNTSTYEVYKKTTGSWGSVGNIKGAVGETGATGAQGIQGIAGIDGADGSDGAIWYYGTESPPLQTFGNENNYYLNTSTYELYQKTLNVYTPAPTNLLTGATATASSTNGGYVAGRTIDGSFTSTAYWMSLGGVTAASVKYDFGVGVSKKITRMDITPRLIAVGQSGVRDFTIEASNDDATWHQLAFGTIPNYDTLTTFPVMFANANSYRYYRISALTTYGTYCTIWEVVGRDTDSTDWQSLGNLRGADGGGSVWLTGTDDPPTQEEGELNDYYLNTTTKSLYKKNVSAFGSTNLFTGGVTSASTTWQSGFESSKALDDSTSTKWAATSGSSNWWKYDLGVGNEKIVSKVTINPAVGGVKDYVIYGSNDDVNWTSLTNGTLFYSSDTAKTFDIEFGNSTAYRYYKFLVVNAYFTTFAQIAEIKAYGLTSLDWQKVIDFSVEGAPGTPGVGWYQLDGDPTADFGNNFWYALNKTTGDMFVKDQQTLGSDISSQATLTATTNDGLPSQLTDNNLGTAWTSNSRPVSMTFDFGEGNEKKVTYFSILPLSGNGNNMRAKDLNFKGSNDGLTWTDLGNVLIPNLPVWTQHTIVNENYYRYYKMTVSTTYDSSLVQIYEIEFKENTGIAWRKTGNIKQYAFHTGTTAPAESLGNLNDTYLNTTDYNMYKKNLVTNSETTAFAGGQIMASTAWTGSNLGSAAFDGNDSSTYWWATGATNQWVIYDLGLGNSSAITKFEIKPYVNVATSASGLKNYSIEASNDGIAWQNLTSGVLPNNLTPQFYPITFANETSYRFYRINGIDSYWTYVGIYEIKGFSITSDNWQVIGNIKGETGETGATGAAGTNSLWANDGTNMSFITGNVGIGDATPAALLTVGDGDLFQVNATGDVLGQSFNGLTLSSATDGFIISGGTTDSRALTISGTDITLDQSLSTTDSPEFAGLTLTGNLDLGVNTITTTNTTLVANLNADLLDGHDGAYYLQNASISGTQNYLPKFQSNNTLTDSLIYDSGSNIVIGSGESEDIYSFATKADYITGGLPTSVSVGNFNGDGFDDLVTVDDGSGTFSILMNNGNGTFTNKVSYSSSGGPYSASTGDFNGDGFDDVAVVSRDSDKVFVGMNNGNGTFNGSMYGTGDSPYSVSTGDFNGDGHIDLATANRGANTVSVFTNNGNGTFANKVDYAVGAGPYSVSATDFNDDGYLDLAAANNVSSTVSVLINNGSGTFATKVDYATSTRPYSVSAADFNGDGYVDLVTANNVSNTVSVLMNNGSGTFATKVDYTTGSAPYSVSTGDFNDDSYIDLAVVNSNSNTVSIFINNEDGTFANRVDYATSTKPFSVSTGDFNKDGLDDLVSANNTSNTVSILLNMRTPGVYDSLLEVRGGDIFSNQYIIANNATGGIVTRVSSGAPTDSAMNGTIVIDPTNHRMYFRYGDVWHYVAQTAGFQIPNYEVAPPDQLSEALRESDLFKESNFPNYLTEKITPGELLIPYVDEYMQDGAAHGLYARFADVKAMMFEETDTKILTLEDANKILNTKTTESITTLEEIKKSTTDQLDLLNEDIDELKTNLANLEEKTEENNILLTAIDTRVISLEDQMKTLKEQNGAVIDFITALNTNSLIYKDIAGNLNLGEGRITAQDIEALGTIKAQDIEAKNGIKGDVLELSANTSGKATIKAGETEVLILSPYSKKDAKISITPQGSTQNEIIYYEEVAEGESFKVKIDQKIEKDINFNWLIIK